MTGRRALRTQQKDRGLLSGSRAAANDEPTLPRRVDISPLTLAEAPAFAPCPANDDWIEADLPVSVKLLDEEIVLLDQFLRVQILALFD